MVNRGADRSSYRLHLGPRRLIGVSFHRRIPNGPIRAVSLLGSVGDGVPLQLVFGDWWEPYRD